MEEVILTPHQEVIRAILINRFNIPPDNIDSTKLQLLTQESTSEQVRGFSFSIVSQYGTEKHPVRMMSEVSKTAVEFAQILKVEFEDFPCNIGNVDFLNHPPSEPEFTHLPDLAAIYGTEAFALAEAIRDYHLERWYKRYGSGYHNSGILPETVQALECLMERANLPLIRDNEPQKLQAIKLSLGASEGLSIAFACINNYFKSKNFFELSLSGDKVTMKKLKTKMRNKTNFVHFGPSFVATDTEAISYGDIHTPQLESTTFEITDEYIKSVRKLIKKKRNNCLIIEDSPNPIGKRLTKEEWKRLEQLMDEFPDLVCVLDHAYVGLAQDEDLSAMMEFRERYVDRIISIGSISKVGANPMERIGAVIYPIPNTQQQPGLGNAVESYMAVLHPTTSINQESYVLSKLQVMLAGDNIYKRGLLLALAELGPDAFDLEKIVARFGKGGVRYYFDLAYKALSRNDFFEYLRKIYFTSPTESELSQHQELLWLENAIYKKNPSTKYIEEETSKLFRARTQLLHEVLSDSRNELNQPLFERIIKPQNTLYVFAKLPDGMSSLDLYLKTGIAAVPGECFGEAGKGWIRLSVGILSEDEIRKMGIVLGEAFNQANKC